ncbi:MAG: glutamyl-tRNA reductase [Candidatus Aureabacteria bacterium]|nr:glutamyl-tRNA reductase [Candidatus Auribacterota bacterium]
MSLRNRHGVHECLILSTCLRFEIYAVVRASSSLPKPLEEYIHDSHAVSKLASLDDVTFIEGEEAVRHLFSVACGLDSHIIGEKQIVGQIKNAYHSALGLGCTGPVLNRLFQKCMNVSKSVRNRTGIDKGICSAASLAVKLLLDTHGSMRDKRVLILGAGQMGKLVGLHLRTKGCEDIYFCSRSVENAKAVAEQCSAGYIPYSQFFEMLQRVDILVTATGAPHEVIGYHDMQEVMERRKGSLLCILDLADPPDVNHRISTLEGISYYPINRVDELAVKTRNTRIAAAGEAWLLIDEAVKDFNLSRLMDKSFVTCTA